MEDFIFEGFELPSSKSEKSFQRKEASLNILPTKKKEHKSIQVSLQVFTNSNLKLKAIWEEATEAIKAYSSAFKWTSIELHQQLSDKLSLSFIVAFISIHLWIVGLLVSPVEKPS